MSRMTECSYRAGFETIKTTVINSQAIEKILADYERALGNACRFTFPNAIIAECSVHYDRVGEFSQQHI